MAKIKEGQIYQKASIIPKGIPQTEKLDMFREHVPHVGNFNRFLSTYL